MSKKIGKNPTLVAKKSVDEQKNVQVFIDENDRKILRTLLFDPRLSYREVARRTRLSVGTVSDRMRKMYANKVLNGFYPNINAKKFGYDLTAVIEVTTTKGAFLDTAKDIAKVPNVYAVYDIAGPFDTVVIAKFRDPEELNEFLKFLQSKEYVVKTETHVVLETIKEDFRFKI